MDPDISSGEVSPRLCDSACWHFYQSVCLMPIKNLNQFSIWIAHILRYLWLTLLFYYYNAPSESACELSSYRVSELSLFAARIFEMDGDIRGFARFMFYAPTSEGHSPSAHLVAKAR